jgi:hypothetical protein
MLFVNTSVDSIDTCMGEKRSIYLATVHAFPGITAPNERHDALQSILPTIKGSFTT